MLLGVEPIPLWPSEPRIWSVADVNRYVRQLLEGDYRLQDLWVAGEVSGPSRPASGHLYFTLKDSEASLRCVMWRSEVVRQATLPDEGQALEVHGHLSVYEAGGQYQLYADALRPAGEGILFREFLRLKARLESEGLFDPQRKRPLPAWPRRIGLVTSPTGAAVRDVLHVLRRRFPLAEVILAPTAVQGAEAPAGIITALEGLNTVSSPDVILVVRGGGALEDLWAFNDEDVVRAIAASAAPVVTGIGHETDFTLADFAADRRAPTPSAAAEVATPDGEAIKRGLASAQRSLARALQREVEGRRWGLTDRLHDLRRASPQARLANARQRLDDLGRLTASGLRHRIALRRMALAGLAQTLRAMDPTAVLGRGYAVVRRRADQRLVQSVRQVRSGDRLDVRVSDGTFGARVDDGAGTGDSI
jgi:exodeoxyribonuclease VII large subunit